MARSARVDVGDVPYHVLNRAVGRTRIFRSPREYKLFLDLLAQAKEETGMRILAYALMPNHWHLALYPRDDGDMGIFMHRITNAHTRRVHAESGTTGTGPLYQGRYKSFMIEHDAHLLTVIKYIERNPVRAKLVKQCEDWQWSSAVLRTHRSPEHVSKVLDTSPAELPRQYSAWINTPDRDGDLDQLRNSMHRGTPFGHDTWVETMVGKHDLLATVRREGRPSKL